MKSWEVILSKCPYCDEYLNISSMSKIHLDKYRGGDEKKSSNIKIRTVSEESGTKVLLGTIVKYYHNVLYLL